MGRRAPPACPESRPSSATGQRGCGCRRHSCRCRVAPPTASTATGAQLLHCGCDDLQHLLHQAQISLKAAHDLPILSIQAANATHKCVLELHGRTEAYDACTTLSGTPGAYTFFWKLLHGNKLRGGIDSINPGGYTGEMQAPRQAHMPQPVLKVPPRHFQHWFLRGSDPDPPCAGSKNQQLHVPLVRLFQHLEIYPHSELLVCRLGRGLPGRPQDGARQRYHRACGHRRGQRRLCGGLHPGRVLHRGRDAAVLLDRHRCQGVHSIITVHVTA